MASIERLSSSTIPPDSFNPEHSFPRQNDVNLNQAPPLDGVDLKRREPISKGDTRNLSVRIANRSLEPEGADRESAHSQERQPTRKGFRFGDWLEDRGDDVVEAGKRTRSWLEDRGEDVVDGWNWAGDRVNAARNATGAWLHRGWQDLVDGIHGRNVQDISEIFEQLKPGQTVSVMEEWQIVAPTAPGKAIKAKIGGAHNIQIMTNDPKPYRVTGGWEALWGVTSQIKTPDALFQGSYRNELGVILAQNTTYALGSREEAREVLDGMYDGNVVGLKNVNKEFRQKFEKDIVSYDSLIAWHVRNSGAVKFDPVKLATQFLGIGYQVDTRGDTIPLVTRQFRPQEKKDVITVAFDAELSSKRGLQYSLGVPLAGKAVFKSHGIVEQPVARIEMSFEYPYEPGGPHQLPMPDRLEAVRIKVSANDFNPLKRLGFTSLRKAAPVHFAQKGEFGTTELTFEIRGKEDLEKLFKQRSLGDVLVSGRRIHTAELSYHTKPEVALDILSHYGSVAIEKQGRLHTHEVTTLQGNEAYLAALESPYLRYIPGFGKMRAALQAKIAQSQTPNPAPTPPTPKPVQKVPSKPSLPVPPVYKVVEPGDTLSGIVGWVNKDYPNNKTTVPEMAALNGKALNPNLLELRERIYLTEQNAPTHHTVAAGESVSLIAFKYGMSLESLLKLNPELKNPNLIEIGDPIRVRSEPVSNS